MEKTSQNIRHVCLMVPKTDVEDTTPGKESLYTGHNRIIMAPNGMSSLNTSDGTTLYLVRGTPVCVCTRPVIPFETQEPSVLIHFKLNCNYHPSKCSCGQCDSTFDISTESLEVCSCGTEEYDVGKQRCSIM